MRSSSSPIVIKVCCLAIISLSFWLGGFGCAFCCATGLTEACCLDELGASAQRQTPPERNCCQRSKCKDSDPRETIISQMEEIKGCSLLPNKAVALGVVSQNIDDSFLIPLPTQPLLVLDGIPLHKAYLIPPSPLNRGGTYLRCCVLLI